MVEITIKIVSAPDAFGEDTNDLKEKVKKYSKKCNLKYSKK